MITLQQPRSAPRFAPSQARKLCHSDTELFSKESTSIPRPRHALGSSPWRHRLVTQSDVDTDSEMSAMEVDALPLSSYSVQLAMSQFQSNQTALPDTPRPSPMALPPPPRPRPRPRVTTAKPAQPPSQTGPSNSSTSNVSQAAALSQTTSNVGSLLNRSVSDLPLVSPPKRQQPSGNVTSASSPHRSSKTHKDHSKSSTPPSSFDEEKSPASQKGNKRVSTSSCSPPLLAGTAARAPQDQTTVLRDRLNHGMRSSDLGKRKQRPANDEDGQKSSEDAGSSPKRAARQRPPAAWQPSSDCDDSSGPELSTFARPKKPLQPKKAQPKSRPVALLDSSDTEFEELFGLGARRRPSGPPIMVPALSIPRIVISTPQECDQQIEGSRASQATHGPIIPQSGGHQAENMPADKDDVEATRTLAKIQDDQALQKLWRLLEQHIDGLSALSDRQAKDESLSYAELSTAVRPLLHTLRNLFDQNKVAFSYVPPSLRLSHAADEWALHRYQGLVEEIAEELAQALIDTASTESTSTATAELIAFVMAQLIDSFEVNAIPLAESRQDEAILNLYDTPLTSASGPHTPRGSQKQSAATTNARQGRVSTMRRVVSADTTPYRASPQASATIHPWNDPRYFSKMMAQCLKNYYEDHLAEGEAMLSRPRQLPVPPMPRNAAKWEAYQLQKASEADDKQTILQDRLRNGSKLDEVLTKRERQKAVEGQEPFASVANIRFLGQLYLYGLLGLDVVEKYLHRLLFDTAYPGLPSLRELECGCVLLLSIMPRLHSFQHGDGYLGATTPSSSPPSAPDGRVITMQRSFSAAVASSGQQSRAPKTPPRQQAAGLSSQPASPLAFARSKHTMESISNHWILTTPSQARRTTLSRHSPMKKRDIFDSSASKSGRYPPARVPEEIEVSANISASKLLRSSLARLEELLLVPEVPKESRRWIQRVLALSQDEDAAPREATTSTKKPKKLCDACSTEKAEQANGQLASSQQGPSSSTTLSFSSPTPLAGSASKSSSRCTCIKSQASPSAHRLRVERASKRRRNLAAKEKAVQEKKYLKLGKQIVRARYSASSESGSSSAGSSGGKKGVKGGLTMMALSSEDGGF